MTLETAKMSERGQIIIPKDIRDFIHASDGTIFTVIPFDESTIVMRKLDKDQLIGEFRAMRASLHEKLSSEDINREITAARKQRKQ